MKTLLIVESPGKISKITGFLGKGYVVKACMGIFRDLDPKKMSIDFDNNFEPNYVITKPDVVKNLKSAMKNIGLVLLATDNDTEGHGMAQALLDVLKPKKYKRILFNEISKKAILNGIKGASTIDKNQVSAQKTRRVIDRLFGFMVSPIVQKKVGGRSAGRVQLATLRLVIDKENEIINFMENNSDSTFFKVGGTIGDFKVSLFETTKPDTDAPLKGSQAKIPVSDSNTDIIQFLRRCLKSKFTVGSVETKPAVRSPSPPFTTSTLQQEANRKYGMTIDVTMYVAQKLYEGGYITYMRTDSVEISEDAHKEIKCLIEKEFGLEYYKKTSYKNKNSSAQLAHECIRPVDPNLIKIEEDIDDPNQIKLYKLIWARTIASQMAQAKLNITTIQILISTYTQNEYVPFYYFQSSIEKIIFLGFMKVYVESVDDDNTDPQSNTKFEGTFPKVGSELPMKQIIAKQEFARPPVRYTQASLVKKLESMGIGRPATYVNTIKTILDRAYVEIGNVPGIKKEISVYEIKSKNDSHIMSIDESQNEIFLGKETKKLKGTGLGRTVIEYMLENFSSLIDYDFTAKMESDMDRVASGDIIWYKSVEKFYSKLKPIVDALDTGSSIFNASARQLGTDADSNKIIALMTKNGPAVARITSKQTYYANLKKPLTVETIELSKAIKLLNLSAKILGSYKNSDVVIRLSKENSHYISWGNKQYCPIPSDTKVADLDLSEAIKLIELNKNKIETNLIGKFTITEGKKSIPVVVMKGKNSLPPYIQVTNGKIRKFYSVPSDIDADKLTEKIIKEIIASKTKSKRSGSKTSKTSKK